MPEPKINKNEIGNIHIIKIINRDPKRPNINFAARSGGLFFDFNTHDFDMIHYLTGNQILEIYAMGDALVQPELKEICDIDTAIITLKLNNNGFAIIDSSRETNFGYDQRIEIFGSKGMIKLENNNKNSMSYISNENYVQSSLPHWSFIERYKESYINEFNAFINYISKDNVPSPVSIDNMIEAVRIAQAAYLSYNKNKLVNLRSNILKQN